MDLSIVSTLYRSAPFLAEFHRRVTAAAERLGLQFEVVYVNDGSPDETQAVAEALCDADPLGCWSCHGTWATTRRC